MAKPVPAAITEQLLSGIQAQQSGDLGRAEAIYLQVLQQCPDQPDALHLLGTVAQAKGQLELATSLIASAIEQDPEVALYHHNLGVVYESSGQAEAALECYQESLRLNPNAYTSIFRAGRLLVNLRRCLEAIPLLLSLSQLGSQAGIPWGEWHLYLAIAYRDQG
ncbi:MAG: tetratricopeptide repeat protein, partial [Thermostichus sp. DG_1_6_bins_120]